MSRYNAEHYPDPTAQNALRAVERDKSETLPVQITLRGVPHTKKNSQRILRGTGGRRYVAPSETYMEYERACLYQIRRPRRAIAEPVNVRCLYYMPDHRRVDLVNLLEATDDILVRAGVLADDRSTIVAGHDGSRVFCDKTRPRVEIEIERMDKELR